MRTYPLVFANKNIHDKKNKNNPCKTIKIRINKVSAIEFNPLNQIKLIPSF